MARVSHDDTIIYLCDGHKHVDDEGTLVHQEVHALQLTTPTEDHPPTGWYTLTNVNAETMHFCTFNCLLRRLMHDQVQATNGQPLPLTATQMGLPTPSATPAMSTPFPLATPSGYSSPISRPNGSGNTLSRMYPQVATPPSLVPLPAPAPAPASSSNPWSTGQQYGFSDGVDGSGDDTTGDDTTGDDDGLNVVDEDTSEFAALIVQPDDASGKGVSTGSTRAAAAVTSTSTSTPSSSSSQRPFQVGSKTSPSGTARTTGRA